MGLDDIPKPLLYPIETWFQVGQFWYKNDLGTYLDILDKCDLLFLNDLHFFQDFNASEYWKRDDLILYYLSNPQNLKQKQKLASMSMRLIESSRFMISSMNSSQSITFSATYLLISFFDIWSGVKSSSSHVIKQRKIFRI